MDLENIELFRQSIICFISDLQIINNGLIDPIELWKIKPELQKLKGEITKLLKKE